MMTHRSNFAKKSAKSNGLFIVVIKGEYIGMCVCDEWYGKFKIKSK